MNSVFYCKINDFLQEEGQVKAMVYDYIKELYKDSGVEKIILKPFKQLGPIARLHNPKRFEITTSNPLTMKGEASYLFFEPNHGTLCLYFEEVEDFYFVVNLSLSDMFRLAQEVEYSLGINDGV